MLLISRRSLDALRHGDRDLLIDTARASVPVMRGLWDASEGAARETVAEYGIAFNDVDMDAFRTAAQPIRDRYLQQPELQALYRRIRDLA